MSGSAIDAEPVAPNQSSQGLVNYTQCIYALHAFSVAVGIVTAATIVTMFLFYLPSIAAVVMNYVRRSEVTGTWLESHFRWQIRTFWYAALWLIVTSVISAPLILAFGLGILTWALGAAAIGIWVCYRVARGWIALHEAKPLPLAADAIGGG
jgi:uncharacterized membrane protein